jgi:hypothetical protein
MQKNINSELKMQESDIFWTHGNAARHANQN